MITIYAASSLFNIGGNLITQLQHLLGLALILGVGGFALHLVMSHQAGKAVALCLMALIPAIFLLDPGGAKTVLTDAVHAIGG